MEKINITELLKDCPKGMEVDCVLYNDVVLHEVHLDDRAFPIVFLRTTNGDTFVTTKYGQYQNTVDGKCIVFPKGKITWEGFEPPCKFKNGDIIFYSNTIAIFKEWGDKTLFRTYCMLYTTVNNHPIYQFEISRPLFGKYIRKEARFATEEEKERLFKAIKDNGYKWNLKTKTLEKLPKFKVGNRIKEKEGEKIAIVEGVYKDSYDIRFDVDGGIGAFTIDLQDEWELVPSKFDINTLVPFESKVLVRDTNKEKWKSSFWGFYDSDPDTAINYPYECCGASFAQCIPYEGNEHLLGTTNDCSEYYKNWYE